MALRQFLKHLNRRDTRLFPYFQKLLVLLILISSIFFSTQAFAENFYKDTQEAIQQGTNQEAWLSNGFGVTLVSGVDSILGPIPDEVIDGQALLWMPNGLAGTTTNAIATLYNPPASGIEYLAQAKDSFLGKPAYAQGIGFKGLEPLIPIWRSFRNFVYIFASIIFVIVGLLIVLRVKISPQAVISIQNAVPQLITTLLLVTFSYAIAGLLIDLSYLFQALAVSLIYPESLSNSNFNLNGVFEFFATKIPLLNVNPSLGTFTNPNAAVFLGVLTIPTLVSIGLATFIGSFIMTLLTLPAQIMAPATSFVAPVAGASIGFVLGLLILSIALLIWVIKFLFGLFKTYAMIIFKIVLAPLEIGMGAFPGSKIGFNTWIMDLIANLLVFPISFLFIILSNKIVLTILLQGSATEIGEILQNLVTRDWNDIGIWAPEIFTQGSVQGVGMAAVGAISLSTLFLLSKLPDMIPQFIFSIKPSPWGQAIGQTGSSVANAPFGAIGFAASAGKNVAEISSWFNRERKQREIIQDSSVTERQARTNIQTSQRQRQQYNQNRQQGNTGGSPTI